MVDDKKNEIESNIKQKIEEPTFKIEKGEEDSWTRFFYSISYIFRSKKLRNKFLFLFLFGLFATIFGFFAGGFIYAKVTLGILICIIFCLVFMGLTIFTAFEIMSKDYEGIDLFAFRFLVLLLVIFVPAILSAIFLSIFSLVSPTSYFLVGNTISLILISIEYLFIFIITFLNKQITKVINKIIKRRSKDLNDQN